MRATLIEGLAAAPHLDGGYLRLLGDVGAALAAIDAASELRVQPGSPSKIGSVGDVRAVVVDTGLSISLSLYECDQALACASLTPLRALNLAGDLLAAGLRRVAIPVWSERG